MSKLNECFENLGIPRAHMDIEQSLMMLEVYKFIERPAKLPKGVIDIKPVKTGSKYCGVIESKFSKAELEQYLLEIEAFSLFFQKSKTNTN